MRWTKTILYSLASSMIVLISNFSTMATERQLQSFDEINSIQWAVMGGSALLAFLNDLKAALTKSPVEKNYEA